MSTARKRKRRGGITFGDLLLRLVDAIDPPEHLADAMIGAFSDAEMASRPLDHLEASTVIDDLAAMLAAAHGVAVERGRDYDELRVAAVGLKRLSRALVQEAGAVVMPLHGRRSQLLKRYGTRSSDS